MLSQETLEIMEKPILKKTGSLTKATARLVKPVVKPIPKK